MFRSFIQDLKQTWKPATLTYVIAVIINLITGWSMDSIIVGIFGIVFSLIFLWVLYVWLKGGFKDEGN